MQGGSSRTSQRPTMANQTKQTLTCCGQCGGMEGQGQSGIRQWSRRLATASIKIEIAWVVHKKNDRAQGRLKMCGRSKKKGRVGEQRLQQPWSLVHGPWSLTTT